MTQIELDLGIETHGDRELVWNHRVVKKNNEFGVHAVYYNDNGLPAQVSSEPLSLRAESQEDLKWILRMMEANMCMEALDFHTLLEK